MYKYREGEGVGNKERYEGETLKEDDGVLGLFKTNWKLQNGEDTVYW